jgi:hypothetical protein
MRPFYAGQGMMSARANTVAARHEPPGTIERMTTVQIIGIAVASLAVLLLVIALLVTRRSRKG